MRNTPGDLLAAVFFLRRERNGLSGMSRVLRWLVKWRHLGGVED